jgi:uncharacterized membrane protein
MDKTKAATCHEPMVGIFYGALLGVCLFWIPLVIALMVLL